MNTFNEGRKYERESTYETCQIFEIKPNNCTYKFNCYTDSDGDKHCKRCNGIEFCYHRNGVR